MCVCVIYVMYIWLFLCGKSKSTRAQKKSLSSNNGCVLSKLDPGLSVDTGRMLYTQRHVPPCGGEIMYVPPGTHSL